MKLSLDIAFFGSSIVSAFRNGAATYYRGMARALAARGHRITFIEPRLPGREKHRDLADPSWAEVAVYSANDASDVERMLERARRADVVVKASHVGAFDELLEQEIPRIVKPGATSIFWDVDAATTISRLTASEAAGARPLLSRYDLVFTHAGGRALERKYADLGARLCLTVHPALDPLTHFPVPSSPTWQSDLSLLANWRADREPSVRELFFRAAEQLRDRTFVLGGSDWDDVEVPTNVRTIGHVYTAEHNGFHAGARAVLAIACDELSVRGWSPPARLFEAAGAGACIVTNAWEGLDDFLEPDREVLVAKDAAAVAEIVRTLDPVRARTIGAAARARVLSHHTYAQRAQLVDSIFVASAPSIEAVS